MADDVLDKVLERSAGAPLAAGSLSLRGWCCAAGSSINRWSRILGLRPARYRRQYADEPGPRAARRAGLVRPSPASARPAARRRNIHWSRLVDLPLAGLILLLRPLGRRRRCRADRRSRSRRCCRSLLLLFCAGADDAAADRPARLSAAVHRPVLRRFDHRHVHADADRPSRLAARAARAWRLPGWPIRSARAAARRSGIATALSLSIGLEMMIYLALAGGATVLLWVADRDRAAAAGGLCGGAGAAARRSASCLRLLRQPPGGVRRLVAGVAVAMPCSAGRCCSAWRCCRPRLEATAGAGGRGAASLIAGFHALAWPHCLHAARRRVARSRPALARAMCARRGRSTATAGGSRH